MISVPIQDAHEVSDGILIESDPSPFVLIGTVRRIANQKKESQQGGTPAATVSPIPKFCGPSWGLSVPAFSIKIRFYGKCIFPGTYSKSGPEVRCFPAVTVSPGPK